MSLTNQWQKSIYLSSFGKVKLQQIPYGENFERVSQFGAQGLKRNNDSN